MNGASPLPRKDFLPYLLPQLADRMYNLSSTPPIPPNVVEDPLLPENQVNLLRETTVGAP